MGDIVQFESPNPDSWTVENALERALENVRSGKFKADKVYVALCEGAKDGNKTAKIYYTVAGMQLPECLGWLHMHMNVLLSED